MKENQLKNKGITLIALVITIIILLILSGVTIAMITGENGILKYAIEAKEEYEKKAMQEKVNLIITELITNQKIDGKQITKEDLEKKLKENGIEATVDDTKTPWEIQLTDGTIIKLDKNIKVEENVQIQISQDLQKWLDNSNINLTVEDILDSKKLLDENGLKPDDIKDAINKKKAAELIQNTSEKEFTIEMAVTSPKFMEKVINTKEYLDFVIENKEILKEIISSEVAQNIINSNEEVKQKIEALIQKVTKDKIYQIIYSDEVWNASGAFDNNMETAWCNRTGNIPSYVGCQLLEKMRLYEFEVYTGIQDGNLVKKFIIQGSNDGTNWVDLTEELTSQTNDIKSLAYKGKPTKNQNQDYLYFRVYCTEGGRTSETQISEVYFYGM